MSTVDEAIAGVVATMRRAGELAEKLYDLQRAINRVCNEGGSDRPTIWDADTCREAADILSAFAGAYAPERAP